MYSSKDEVSEFKMVGDKSCPSLEVAWSFVTVQLDKIEIHELRPKVLTEDEGDLVWR